MAMNVNHLIVKFLADTTQFNSQMKSMEGNLATFSARVAAQARETNNTFTRIGGTLTGLGTVMQKTGAVLTRNLTVPLAVIGAAAIKTGVDFETAFAGVKKTIDATPEEFAVLAKAVQDIAIKTGTSVTEVAASMQAAGQLGIRGSGALSAFTETVSELAIATGMSAQPLAMMLGKFAAVTGLDVEKDIRKIGAVIADLGNKTATTEKDILKFAVRLGASASLVGMSQTEILALAAATEASGTKAERGGTALTKILLKMQQEALGGAVANDEYSASIDSNNKELAKWKDTLADLTAQQNNMGANATAEEMQQVSDAIVTAQENIAALTEANESLRDTVKSTGKETLSFAEFLGITNEEFSAMFKNADGGAMDVFEMFLGRVSQGFASEEQVFDLLNQLGLSDTRLVQTVLSLAKANEAIGESGEKASSSLESALANARIAYAEATGEWSGALNREVIKRLDTVSGQWNVLKEIVKTFAVIFTGDTNKAMVDFLRTMNERLVGIIDYLRANPEVVSKITKAFLGLLALGPGLTVFGKILGSFGTAFSTLGVLTGAFKAGEGATGIAKLTGAFGNLGKKAKGLFGGRGTGSGWVINNLPRDRFGRWISPGQEGYDQAMAARDLKKKPSWLNLKRVKVDRLQSGQMALGAPSDNAYQGVDGRWRDKTTNRFTQAPDRSGMGSGASSGLVYKKTMFGKAVDAKNTALGGMSKMLAQMQIRMEALKMLTPKWLQGLLGGFAKLLPLVKGVAFALGGWAVVIAAIAIGLAALFVGMGKTTGQVREIFSSIVVKVREVGAMVSGFMTNLIENLIPDFMGKMAEMLPTILTGLDLIVTEIITVFWDLLPKLIEVLSTILVNLVTMFSDNLPQILDMLIGWVLQFLQGLLDNLPSILDSIFAVITSVVTAFFEALPQLFVAAIELLWDALDTILNADWGAILGSLLTGIWDVISGVFTGFATGLTTAFPGFFEGVTQFFTDGFDAVIEFIGGVGSSIITALSDGIKAGWTWLTTESVKFDTWFKDLFKSAGTWLYESGKTVIKGIQDGLKWAWDNTLKAAFDVRTWFKDLFSGAGKWLFDAGKDIIQGLLDGLGDMGASIGKFFLDILPEWIREPFKLALKIKSPSRVFMGYGQMIGQGLINGMASMEEDIVGASDMLAQATLIDPAALNQAMSLDANGYQPDYTALAEAVGQAISAVGLEVYMDGKKVTDVVSTELALEQRRTK